MARNITFYDFMGVGSDSGSDGPSELRSPDHSSWPIKRELTPAEVRDDVFYMEKHAFESYILPYMSPSQRRRLSKGSVVQIVVRDERCVFFMTQLYMYDEYYALTNFRSQRQTFIRSRELVAGQKVWIRWINSYMELKVIE